MIWSSLGGMSQVVTIISFSSTMRTSIGSFLSFACSSIDLVHLPCATSAHWPTSTSSCVGPTAQTLHHLGCTPRSFASSSSIIIPPFDLVSPKCMSVTSILFLIGRILPLTMVLGMFIFRHVSLQFCHLCPKCHL